MSEKEIQFFFTERAQCETSLHARHFRNFSSRLSTYPPGVVSTIFRKKTREKEGRGRGGGRIKSAALRERSIKCQGNFMKEMSPFKL